MDEIQTDQNILEKTGTGQSWEETNYGLIHEQLVSLLEGETDEIVAMANAAALLYGALPGLNWLGFYRLRGTTLVLGPFQGKPACTRIALGKGVCGTSAASGMTLVVPDVHQFSGHIACDSASNSEIVVPIRDETGAVRSILDVDSPHYNRFSKEDQKGLEDAAAAIGKVYRCE